MTDYNLELVDIYVHDLVPTIDKNEFGRARLILYTSKLKNFEPSIHHNVYGKLILKTIVTDMKPSTYLIHNVYERAPNSNTCLKAEYLNPETKVSILLVNDSWAELKTEHAVRFARQ